MKIVHMVDIPWDSGLANYALVLAQGLQKNGHTVYFCSKPNEKPGLKAQRLALPTIPWATLQDLFALRRFLQDKQIDIVNAHTGSTHTLAVAAAWGTHTRVIRTRSDARPVKKSFGSGFLYAKTAHVIAAAAYIRQDFIRLLNLPAEKVTTIYQGLDLNVFSTAPLPAEPVFGMIARLDPVKGHADVLHALALLKKHGLTPRLDIVGQPENIKEQTLRDLAQHLGVAEQVKFWGYQSDIPGAIRACAIGLIASTGSEAVSRAAQEWMASGRPVIATRVGCLPELIKEGETGFLVPPSDPAALAEAITYFLQNPSVIVQMGRRSRQVMQAHYSIDGFIFETEALYNSLL